MIVPLKFNFTKVWLVLKNIHSKVCLLLNIKTFCIVISTTALWLYDIDVVTDVLFYLFGEMLAGSVSG